MIAIPIAYLVLLFDLRFTWSGGVAEISVVSATRNAYSCVLLFRGNRPASSWGMELRSDDGPLNEPPVCEAKVSAYKTRLIALYMQVPNWNKVVLWVAGPAKSEPLVFKFRDAPGMVIRYHASKGAVQAVTLYDRWVGGPARVTLRGGKRLDRWEEVTEYRVEPRGFVVASHHFRLVPYRGGGVTETAFRRMPNRR